MSLPMMVVSFGPMIPPPIDKENPPPADYPKLKEVLVKHESLIATHKACSQGVSVPGIFFACTLPDYCAKTVTIHYYTDLFIEHERLHAKGYSHPNDNFYADLWKEWRDGDGKGWCRMRMGEANYRLLHGDGYD